MAFVFIATGARYTYAEVPLPEAIMQALGWSRKHFDRFGHFVQGLAGGLIARKLLLWRTTLGGRV